jgi:hypothetical protein
MEALMQYLLLICAEGTGSDENDILERGPTDEPEGTKAPPASANASADANAYRESPAEWSQGRGILVTGSPAQPSMEATLEFRGDGVLITDGPYAHVQGHIQGFDIIDSEQLMEVIELASRLQGQQTAGQSGQPDFLM